MVWRSWGSESLGANEGSDEMGETAGTLARDGVVLHWWMTSGDSAAPLVVCTHGGAMDHRMWAPQVDALCSTYRVLTHDVRGHGLSRCTGAQFSLDAAADDLVALMDAAGAEKAVLVGHSVGASVSQLVALRHPARVAALVGIGAACITMPTTPTARLRQAVNPLALGVLGQKRVRAMFADMAGVKPEVKEYARRAMEAVDDDVFAAIMGTGFGHPERVPEGYTIGVPLLLLQGDREPYGAFLGRSQRWVERDGGRLCVVSSGSAQRESGLAGFRERGDSRVPGWDSRLGHARPVVQGHMAGGSWNRHPLSRVCSRNSPEVQDAWSKYRLGVLKSAEITSGSLSIPQSHRGRAFDRR